MVRFKTRGLPLKYVKPGEDKIPFDFAAFLSLSFTSFMPASSSSMFLVSSAARMRSQVLQFLLSAKKVTR